MIYIIGSLRQGDKIRQVAKELRNNGHDIFDDWLSAGPDADDYLRDHFVARDMKFREALASPAAQNIFEFDKKHILQADTVVLVMPAGKSAFLELGWALGKGKKGYILFPDGDPERLDIMMKFADDIFYSVEELVEELKPKTKFFSDMPEDLPRVEFQEMSPAYPIASAPFGANRR